VIRMKGRSNFDAEAMERPKEKKKMKTMQA
jgi:hypothetical protein